MPTYSDEYLNHWGQIFTDNHIGGYTDAWGNPINFELFLQAPEDYLYAIAFNGPLPVPGLVMRPLLPQQRAIQQQLDWEERQARKVPQRPIRWAGFALMQRLNPFAKPKHDKCHAGRV